MLTASPELCRLIAAQDIATLRALRQRKPDGPRDAAQIAAQIAAIERRLGLADPPAQE